MFDDQRVKKMALPCLHPSAVVKSGCGDLSASGTAPAQRLGWRRLLRSWHLFSPLHLMLRKREGKRFPSSKKIMLSSPCAPDSGKEPGRVGAACSVHRGQAAALQHPPACHFSSFSKVLLQFAGETLRTPLIHTLPAEQPFKSCTQAAALAAMVRGLVFLSSGHGPCPFLFHP